VACQNKSKIVGVSISISESGAVIAHHGCADDFFTETTLRFNSIGEVLKGLRDPNLNAEVKDALLRNLAINGLSAKSIEQSLEATFFTVDEVRRLKRHKAVQRILKWADLPPGTDPKSVKELKIRDFYDKDKTLEGIGEFSNLESFALRQSSFYWQQIPDEFWSLPLKSLIMYRTQLGRLPPEVARLTNLQSLQIAHSEIYSIPEGLALPNLRELDLSENKIDRLPETMVMPALESLDLVGNGLVELSTALDNLPRLTSLSLQNNQLETMPDVGRWPHLVSLSAANNLLLAAPAGMGTLTSLQHLNLSRNGIREFPSEVGALPNLKEIDLSRNGASVIPPMTSPVLETANFSMNRLPIFPDISRAVGLKRLDLAFNRIPLIPPLENKALEQLFLEHNALTAIPSEIGSLPRLKYLSCGDNAITVVPDELFNDRLELLDLAGTRVEHIPPSITRATRLRGIDLSGNHHLQTVPALAAELPLLRLLRLQGTRFENGVGPLEIRLKRCGVDTTMWEDSLRTFFLTYRSDE
jgi:Leucine-rich repeat (LRR) protein